MAQILRVWDPNLMANFHSPFPNHIPIFQCWLSSGRSATHLTNKGQYYHLSSERSSDNRESSFLIFSPCFGSHGSHHCNAVNNILLLREQPANGDGVWVPICLCLVVFPVQKDVPFFFSFKSMFIPVRITLTRRVTGFS